MTYDELTRETTEARAGERRRIKDRLTDYCATHPQATAAEILMAIDDPAAPAEA